MVPSDLEDKRVCLHNYKVQFRMIDLASTNDNPLYSDFYKVSLSSLSYKIISLRSDFGLKVSKTLKKQTKPELDIFGSKNSLSIFQGTKNKSNPIGEI